MSVAVALTGRGLGEGRRLSTQAIRQVRTEREGGGRDEGRGGMHQLITRIGLPSIAAIRT